jgi:membrane protein implicated in regulation of membrane protease activity
MRQDVAYGLLFLAAAILLLALVRSVRRRRHGRRDHLRVDLFGGDAP